MILIRVVSSGRGGGSMIRASFSSVPHRQSSPAAIECVGKLETNEEKYIVSPLALSFVAKLQNEFDGRRLELLEKRGSLSLDFDPNTANIRDNAKWSVKALPRDLKERKVEITGPPNSKKLVINALNSGASCYMADFEDSLSPTWHNVVQGQVNLREAIRGTINVSEGGKHYAVSPESQTVLHMRPRGLHLEERNIRIDGKPVSGSFFDFGLYAFHNARALAEKGTGTYVYIPKMESAEEARLWRDMFVATQHALGLSKPISCSVLIETLPAAFAMDEILYELKNHASALNCGRWDYIFSHIKHQATNPAVGTLPDRASLGMDKDFLDGYSKELIRTCHARGALAMGGMAAQIPIKGDAAANEAARHTVHDDKEREVQNGHDGTWVAHPALVDVAKEVFSGHIGPRPNQRNFGVLDTPTTPEENRAREAGLVKQLTKLPTGHLTTKGVQTNVEVFLKYMDAWLGGNGCVALHGRMEDAATAEISRAQLWAWLHHKAHVDSGEAIDLEMIRKCINKVAPTLSKERGAEAVELLMSTVEEAKFAPFLTTPAYSHIVDNSASAVLEVEDYNSHAIELASNEEADFETRVAALEANWEADPRWKNAPRGYDAAAVIALQGSMKPPEYASNAMAKKLWKILGENQRRKTCEYTFGVLDTIQVSHVAKYLDTVYVSGWLCSSTASSSNEPSPDIASYASNTVPLKVEQLFKAQQFHDRRQYEARRRMSNEERLDHQAIDYMNPIVADADTGHGGTDAVMKLAKMFVHAGAAGIHIEDQAMGVKKCGHMSGKVLCSTREQVGRLKAARLQCDILGTQTIVIGRTDAKSANLINNNIDDVDKPFLLGTCKNSPELVTYYEAVELALEDNPKNLDAWKREDKPSFEKAVQRAHSLGATKAKVGWNGDAARTSEGYYPIKCGNDLSVARAIAMIDHCDMVWNELDTPSIEDAKAFADGVFAARPHAKLAINNSPSFNWNASGLSEDEMLHYMDILGSMGYCWSFVTLSGGHIDALATDVFCEDFKKRQMLSYVRTVQDEERKRGVDMLRHQRWSGAELIDAQITTALGSDNYSTSIGGAESTEHQFDGDPETAE